MSKTQFVRLLDIFILGPFMIYFAFKVKQHVSQEEFLAMTTAGVLTIAYNANNYFGHKSWI